MHCPTSSGPRYSQRPPRYDPRPAALARLPGSHPAAHPELPLSIAYGMRNALSHGYFKVDLEIVWKTIHSDLPPLHQLVGTLLKGLA